jgi:hypothetical protein
MSLSWLSSAPLNGADNTPANGASRQGAAVATRRGAPARPPAQGVISMADVAGVDWPGYFRSLPAGEARALAAWLAAEGLAVGEFMEVVDRAYATAPEAWRGRSRPFVARRGRVAAAAYARRKRQCAGLLAALDEALISGALPGDVASRELRPCAPPWAKE